MKVFVLFWVEQYGENAGDEYYTKLFAATLAGRAAMVDYVSRAAACAAFSCVSGETHDAERGINSEWYEWSYDDDPRKPFFRARLTDVCGT